MPRHTAPTFYLYGEAHRLVHKGFVHVESLDDRSRPSEWTIQPHSHDELAHIFIVLSGGGVLTCDGACIPFSSPCFLLVPATTVHAFDWLTDSEGFVLTIATGYALEVSSSDEELASLFETPAAIEISAQDAVRARSVIEDLMRELGWAVPGHRAAVQSAILSLLVTALRHQNVARQRLAGSGIQVSTVARLRERIERRFRLREPISQYANALGVSQAALRAACAQVAGRSPSEMLDQRILLEARRALLYSSLSVAEIGFTVGFTDPAYFSRFFQRHTGLSPRNYRNSQSRIALDNEPAIGTEAP